MTARQIHAFEDRYRTACEKGDMDDIFIDMETTSGCCDFNIPVLYLDDYNRVLTIVSGTYDIDTFTYESIISMRFNY